MEPVLRDDGSIVVDQGIPERETLRPEDKGPHPLNRCAIVYWLGTLLTGDHAQLHTITTISQRDGDESFISSQCWDGIVSEVATGIDLSLMF